MEKGKDTGEVTSVALRTEMQITYDAVCAKLNANKKIEESRWKTNGEFQYSRSSTAINIQKNSDLKTLVNIFGFLLEKSASYLAAIKGLSLDEKAFPAFEWSGYGFQDWKHDIEIRVQLITFENEKKDLLEAKRELEGFFSKDDKLSKSLERIGKLI